MGLEIVDAKEIHLKDDEVRQIVEIESHPEVRRWLTIYVDDDFEREFRGATDASLVACGETGTQRYLSLNLMGA